MPLPLILGFPRIGLNRELKKNLVEPYWKGKISAAELLAAAKDLRARHWALMRDAGVPYVPVNDFSLYDQMLDMSCLLGAVPARYGWTGGTVDLDTYFAMARGRDNATAMEMTKWFDTNYHNIVPELTRDQAFSVSATKIFDEFAEAGENALPVLVGPVTYLSLAKSPDKDFDPVSLLDAVLPVYKEVLSRLKAAGATWVQMDEPCLVTDLTDVQRAAYKAAYAALADSGLQVFLTTYFGGLRDNLDLAFSLPVDCIHVDLVRAPGQFKDCLAKAKETGKGLSLGIVDGRNIWRNDLSASLAVVEEAVAALGDDKVCVAPSCSLLHSPVDLVAETKLDAEIKSWLAFAKQKVDEVVALSKPRAEIADLLAASDKAQESRKTSARIHNPDVQARLAAVTPSMKSRKSPFAARIKAQKAALKLPPFPTTTIGSFPQTKEIRKARADYKAGRIDRDAYEAAMKAEIRAVVDYQEEVGLDVLVHGEAERNDMVEYFGEQLSGFAFTQNGWVQSYGSRCVKPPIIFGDVDRPAPMTVDWAKYAQSCTDHVMKGMLTGPITMLQWSFVRNDQPRERTAMQIALAVRDEVADLEKAGIKVIQIDEAALREGLPLRKSDWQEYLAWAVEAFKLTACTVDDATQIHTHMCYSEFNDIIESIGAMDADVISIETSRSNMELLDAFVTYKYPNEIGPGVYDIHSPRVPPTEDMVVLLDKARDVLRDDQIWVNPDCGLKTRGWAEVKPALANMVAATKALREKAGTKSAAA